MVLRDEGKWQGLLVVLKYYVVLNVVKKQKANYAGAAKRCPKLTANTRCLTVVKGFGKFLDQYQVISNFITTGVLGEQETG